MGNAVLNQVEAVGRLALMGLSKPLLWDPILVGEAQRERVTIFHPPTMGGFNAWGECTGRLRELLRPDGWTLLNICNLPLVVSPGGDYAILVAGGTGGTGTQLEVKTRNPKGSILRLVVQANCQTELFPHLRPPDQTPAGVTPRETWVLLIFRHKDIVRAELSLPSGFDDQERIADWYYRIPLGERDLTVPGTPQVAPPFGEAIDVPVTPTNL